MKSYVLGICLMGLTGLLLLSQCTQKSSQEAVYPPANSKADFDGFESQVKWGEHIVTISGCNDCHTPKKRSDHGPVLDSSLLLSGHPSQRPPIDINRKEIETKGLLLSSDLTEWVGPWGISYAANLSSDATGIGDWTEPQFMLAIREGKYKGLANSRTLLPPMPWINFRNMTDDELKAVFAYLKSTKPINNLVPLPLPPVAAAQ
jgi:hypothetical protein